MHSQLHDLLVEGDRRTVRNVDEAVGLLVSNPNLTGELLEIVQGKSEAAAMRAADCLEKFSRHNAHQLYEFKDNLINILVNVPQKEVRWHLAQILPRLTLSPGDFKIVSGIWFHDFYHSTSSIVRTESLQAIFNIRHDYPLIKSETKTALKYGLNCEFPAVKARASKLFRDL